MPFFKRLLLFTAIAVVLGSGVAFGALWLMPGFFFEWRLDRALVNAGAEFEHAQTESETFEYAIGGDGEAIVFVHGFAGDKRMWTPHIDRLSNVYRVVAPDLPGHGGSSAAPDQIFTLDTMADALGRFVDNQQLERFHLVGASMGGGIALAYAQAHPNRVNSLTLINPWGVSTPKQSDHDLALAGGRNIFFPQSEAEFDELAAHIYGVALPLDDALKDYLLTRALARQPQNELIFSQMHEGPRLDDRLEDLEVRTLVLVGGADRIVHPSSAKTFESRANDIKPVVLPGCGHIFIGVCYERAMEHIEEFLRG